MFEMAAGIAVCLLVTMVTIILMSLPFLGIWAGIVIRNNSGEDAIGIIVSVMSVIIGSVPFFLGFALLGVWTQL